MSNCQCGQCSAVYCTFEQENIGLRFRLAAAEGREKGLREEARKAINIMCPNPPEPWPSYASAISVLCAALA